MEIKKSLTLLELIIVLVVASVLATFAVPSYWGAHQKAAQREAQAMLVLIQAAEKVRHLETGAFQACADIAECNTNLNLDIPTAGSFNYSVQVGVAPDDLFCADADPLSGTGLNARHICTDGAVINGACAAAC